MWATVGVENIYYISQIVASIAVIAGTIIALVQYFFNSKESKKQKEQEMRLFKLQIEELKKDRMQRAIDLSEYYKNNVIYYMNILKYVYDKTGVSEILKNIPDDNICYFDKYELERNIKKADIEKLKNLTQDKNFMEILMRASVVVGFWPECREEKIIIDNNGKTIKKIETNEPELRYKFSLMVQDVLNNLEYFAMAFTHKTADESVVYQSLHGNYMKIVKLLYYDISANNVSGEAKLFTNVIELYNIWKNETEKQKSNEIAATRENISKGNVLKKVDSN